MSYKLTRSRDNLQKQSKEIIYLEWKEDGKLKEKHEKPQIGFSLWMSPFNQFYTWQTTVITEIIEQTQTTLHFKTENSEYHLEQIEDDFKDRSAQEFLEELEKGEAITVKTYSLDKPKSTIWLEEADEVTLTDLGLDSQSLQDLLDEDNLL